MSYVNDPRRHNVLNLLGGSTGTQYVIPVYQRNYVWLPTIQVKDLLDDIKKNVEDNTRIHFIGIIIYLAAGKGSSYERKFYVIDGQQRLTTIFLILYALLDLSKSSNNQSLSEELLNSYLTNPYARNDKLKVKLKPLMNDSSIYEKIASGKCHLMTDKEKDTNLYKSYEYILNYLKKLNTKYDLEEIKEALNRLYLVDFPLGENDNAHQIYESINAKGSKLLSIDLIRNFVLMHTDNDQKEELYENHWFPIEDKFISNTRLEDFFRFFLMNRRLNFISKKNVYDDFQKWYFDNIPKSNMKTLLDEIDIYSDCFNDLYYSELTTIDPLIRSKVQEFRHISSDMPAPFMMEVYKLFKNSEIEAIEFNEITSIIISFIVRRAIIGLDTSGISRFFTTVLKKIYELVDNEDISFLEATKLIFVDSNTGVASRMPTNIELKESLLMINAYDNRDALRWVFDKIENDNNPLQISTKKLQIEHLLPQSSTKWLTELNVDQETYEKYMNKLGNLTLATKKDNITMSNNLFDYKKQILEDSSHLRMNVSILKLTKWNLEEIDKRTVELINQIIALYPYFESNLTNKDVLISGNSTKNANFDFYSRGINKGDTIKFIDDPNITAEVINDRQVRFEGKTWYLSSLTREIYERKNLANKSGAYAGPKYFSFEGTRLSDMPIIIN